jgi:hypothetical protein
MSKIQEDILYIKEYLPHWQHAVHFTLSIHTFMNTVSTKLHTCHLQRLDRKITPFSVTQKGTWRIKLICILEPTTTHFVHIAVCTKFQMQLWIIVQTCPQWQLVFHYTHHVLILTYLLMYGAETFLRSCQLCNHSGNSQQF